MRRITITIWFVLLITAALRAQSSYWYHNLDGSPVYLENYDTLVSVRFDPAIPGSSAQEFVYTHEFLSDAVPIEFGPGGFFVFGVETGYDLGTVVSWLRQNDSVAMVNPVIRNEYGELCKLDNSLIVTYKPGVTVAQMTDLEEENLMIVTEVLTDSLTTTHFMRIDARTSEDITAWARRIYSSGLCEVAEPNLTYAPHANSNDPYFGEQWQLKNTGQLGGTSGADIDWELANQYGDALFTPPVVAVLDAGFQMTHEDFRENCWWHPYDAAGQNINLDDPDYDPTNPCDDTRQHCWHGTAVLGILEAYTGNALGLAGTESKTRIMPVKILDDFSQTNWKAWVRALDWTAKSPGPANVITTSWSATYSAEIERRLGQLYRSGIAVIVATGNRGIVEYPARSPYALAVGMSDAKDDVPLNSGYGTTLDLVAPGVDVWSLDLMGPDGANPGISAHVCDANQNYACHFTGTSFAAPMVAGIAAKLLLRDPWLMGDHYKDSAEVMYDILRRSCERQHYGVSDDDYRRVNDLVGWGRVNEARAISEACKRCGDANDDRAYDIADAIYIISHIFSGGAAPLDCRVPKGLGDANGDGAVDISDAVYLVDRIFSGGAAPHCYGM